MADLLMSTTETTAIVPEKWSANYYDVLVAELPFNSIISRDYEGEIANLGDTVNISSIPEFDEADVLPETSRADAASVTITGQPLVIDMRVVRDFIVTNQAKLQSLPFVDKLEQMAAYSINKKIQALIIARIIPSASSPDHQIAYDSGTTLGLADFLEVKELLDNANVPDGDRHWVGGAAQTNDIFNITGFTSSDFLMSGSPLQSGQVGSPLLGFQPHKTTVVGNTGYFFHGSFMTMAAQEGLSVKVYDLGGDGTRASRVNVDTLIGIKQLDDVRVASMA